MGLMLAAAAFGFAEATLFFIVPDVLITWAASRQLRAGVLASLAAVAGALLGGIIMYAWGMSNIQGASAMLDLVPAISPEMIARARDALEAAGLKALFLGPLLGTPYKVYAVQAAAAHIGLVALIVVSVPARLARFLLLASLTAAVRRFLIPNWRQPSVDALVLGAWAVFYAAFLSLMPN